MTLPDAGSTPAASTKYRRYALDWDLRLRRTGERLACWLDRSPDPIPSLRSRGVRLLPPSSGDSSRRELNDQRSLDAVSSLVVP